MIKETSSFRDPSGQVFINDDGNIRRAIDRNYYRDYQLLMTTRLYDELVEANLLIPHKVLTYDPLLIEPEKIKFISYPYEWCFSMLKEAALNTLEINHRSMEHGMMLKDASAYNMQWRNGKMVLIDTLSFIRYENGMPWWAYQQFVQHFLYPLLLMAYRDAELNRLSEIYLDGIPARSAVPLLPFKLRFNLSAWAHAYSQSLKFVGKDSVNQDLKMSRVAFDALLDNLERFVKSIKYNISSDWTKYEDAGSYTMDALFNKREIIDRLLSRINSGNLIDLGCNLGYYSDRANSKGHKVISTDLDHDCIEYIYKSKISSLMLVIDICNPSPAIGWANQERKSFWSRVNVDTIMALALIHHLCIGNNVPLAMVANLLSDYCRNLIIEFVPPEDPKARLLLSKRIVPHYSIDIFKTEFSKYFKIINEYSIKDSLRTIFLMEKR